MIHDRSVGATKHGPRPPWWGPSLGERSARLPSAPVLRSSPSGRPLRSRRSWTPARWWIRRPLWWPVPDRVRELLVRAATRGLRRGDRGDVPGWVLVTLMTAGLVLVLWGIARDRLAEVFNHAIDSVLGGG